MCIGNNCQIIVLKTQENEAIVHFFGDYPAYMFVIDDVFCKIIEICKTKPTEANYLFTSYNCNLEECYSSMVEIIVFFLIRTS